MKWKLGLNRQHLTKIGIYLNKTQIVINKIVH